MTASPEQPNYSSSTFDTHLASLAVANAAKRPLQQEIAALAEEMRWTAEIHGAGTVCDGYPGDTPVMRRVQLSLMQEQLLSNEYTKHQLEVVAYASNLLWDKWGL